jgi:DNA repair protein RadC
VLTHVRAVNRTDAALMGSERRSLASIFQATEKELSSVPGLGPTKVKRLFAAIDAPFYINQRKPEAAETNAGPDVERADLLLSEKEAREWVATQQVNVEQCVASDSDDEER